MWMLLKKDVTTGASMALWSSTKKTRPNAEGKNDFTKLSLTYVPIFNIVGKHMNVYINRRLP